jgi:hypothetical protein
MKRMIDPVFGTGNLIAWTILALAIAWAALSLYAQSRRKADELRGRAQTAVAEALCGRR